MHHRFRHNEHSNCKLKTNRSKNKLTNQITKHPASLRLAILSPLGRHGGAQHGGITPIVRHLARCALARGISVDLLLCSAETAEAPSGARVISLGQGSKFQQFIRLQIYLRKHTPQALLSAGMRANYLAAFAAKFATKTRVVASLHNTLSRSLDKKWFKQALWGRLLRWPTHLVAVSLGVADDAAKLLDLDRTSLHVIYNPVVTTELHMRASEPADHPWFNDGGAPVIIAVGRLEPQKDYATLIAAFEQLINTGADYRMVILGEGKLRAELEAQIAQLGLTHRVSLPGFVSNPYSCMTAARLLVSSSRWEGLPTVLIEALALGCPVVATDCPSGPREILDNGRYGPLVPVGDIEALSETLATILKTHPDRANLREAAKRFTVDAAGDRYLELLLDLPPSTPKAGFDLATQTL